jgi:hypothetical protein
MALNINVSEASAQTGLVPIAPVNPAVIAAAVDQVDGTFTLDSGTVVH